MNEPKVSVIIPVKNAGRTISKMFEYLYAMDYPEAKLEIILADGGSTDDTIKIIKEWKAKHPNIKYVEIKDCKSPGHARNFAIKEVSGEYVLFTDGDCAPDRNWVRTSLSPFFTDPQIGLVGGEILTLKVEQDNLIESYCEQIKFLSPVGRCGIKESGYMPTLEGNFPHEVDGSDRCPFFATANVTLPKKVIDQIGGKFWHYETGEDVDFNLRVLAAGYKIYFAKEALVRHMHRATLKNFLRQWFYYGYGHPLLLTTHASKTFEIIIQPLKNLSFKFPSVQPGIINIGWFHLMHIFGVLTIISLFSFSADLFGWMLLLTVLCASRYFWPCLKLSPKQHFFTWCKIRYLTNYSFAKGAITEGRKKFKSIVIEPSW